LVAPHAEPQRLLAAAFLFQMDGIGLHGTMLEQTRHDRARLGRLDAQLVVSLEWSGRYAPVVVPIDPAWPSLWTCGGRSLLSLPMMRSTRRARSMAVTSSVMASLMHTSQAYMTARQVRWNRAADAAEQAPDLILGQPVRQPLLPRQRDLFFPKQIPGPAERLAEEEPQGGAGDLEGAACHPALAQVQQVGPDLRLAELVRRAPVVLGQLPDRPEIDGLRLRAQPGQDHGLDHLLTLWRHDGSPSLGCPTGDGRPQVQGIGPAGSAQP